MLSSGSLSRSYPCYRTSYSAVLALVILVFIDVGNSSQVFPPAIIAPLGTNATFFCSVSGSSTIKWEINNVQVDLTEGSSIKIEHFSSMGFYEVNRVELSNGTLSSILVVAATVNNKKTTLKCLGFEGFFVHDPFPENQDPSTLWVFGPPGHPQKLMASSFGPNTLRISWIAPQVPFNVDVHYRVMIIEANTFNATNITTNESFFVWTEADPLETCSRYTFQVSSFNEAGESNYSEISNIPLPTLPVFTKDSDIMQNCIRRGSYEYFCEFTFRAAETCPAYPVWNYTVTLANTVTGVLIRLEKALIISSGDIITVSHIGYFEENRNYNFTVTAYNGVGEAQYTTGIIFTTDVQNTRVSLQGMLLSIECRYVHETSAQGCFVQLMLFNSTEVSNVSISRSSISAEIQTSLPTHCYDVLVYNWESDGTIGDLGVVVSRAVWNDSCLEVMTPRSEPGSKDRSPTGLTAGICVAAGVLVVSVIVAGVTVVIVRKKQSAARATGSSNQDGGPIRMVDSEAYMANLQLPPPRIGRVDPDDYKLVALKNPAYGSVCRMYPHQDQADGQNDDKKSCEQGMGIEPEDDTYEPIPV